MQIFIGPLLVLLLTVAGVAGAQEFAAKRLESSPRHHEWVQVASGARKVETFVAFPEVTEKMPVVIVIHENRGLTDWVRLLADELAEAGYVAVAPDLLSGHAPGGGATRDFKSQDEAMRAIYALKPDNVIADLTATADYAKGIEAANGKIAVCGFCWGGGQAFRLATRLADLQAAFVFYGPAPEATSLPSITCPVYGFYGANDARINAGIPATEAAMQKLGKTYEPVIYQGAGHGFMRSGDDPSGREGDKDGREKAWSRWKSLLGKL